MIYLIIYLMIGLITASLFAWRIGAFNHRTSLKADIIGFLLFCSMWPMAILLWVLKKSSI
jgi:ABC-type Na+ efflux pump permease subunit